MYKNIIKVIFALLILVQVNSFAQTAEELAMKLSNPIASLISVPFQNNTDFGIGALNAAKKIILKLEDNLLSKVPGYDIIKKTSESFAGFDTENSLTTVLARIEDAWQLAFLIEEIEDENYAVYIPGTPNPLSGSVYFLEKERIKKTTIPMKEAMKCLRGLGTGSNNLLRGYL